MPFARPSLAELRARTMAAIQAAIPGADAGLRRSVLTVLSNVQAGMTHLELGYLDWMVAQLLPDTASGDYLERWAAIKGLARDAASPAAGNVVFTGTSAGLDIPAGTALTRRSDDAAFATASDARIGGGGTVTVAVVATLGGAAGNTPPGASLTLASAIAGITAQATVDSAGLTGGIDQESDDSYRARLLNLLQRPPQGGCPNDFVQWTLKCAGVTRAWVYPLNRGLGTIDVAFVMDGRSNIVPTPTDVAAVQAYLDTMRPGFGECIVFAPTAAPLNLTIHGLLPNTAAVKAAIAGAVADMLAAVAVPGGMLPFYLIDQAVASVAGVAYYSLISPATDVAVATGHIAVPGTINWT